MNTATSLNKKSWPLMLALLTTGTLAAQGCGGDDNPEPTHPIVTGGASGSGGTAGRGGGKGKAGSGTGGTQSDAGTGAEGNEGGTGDVGSGGTSSSGRGGKGGSSGRGGSGGSGATSGTTGEGGTGNEGSGAEGGSGNEGGQIDCEVRGERNCYRCEPHALDPAPEWPDAVNEQFLNRCDDSLCSPFDNAERIEGWNGTLPTP